MSLVLLIDGNEMLPYKERYKVFSGKWKWARAIKCAKERGFYSPLTPQIPEPGMLYSYNDVDVDIGLIEVNPVRRP